MTNRARLARASFSFFKQTPECISITPAIVRLHYTSNGKRIFPPDRENYLNRTGLTIVVLGCNRAVYYLKYMGRVLKTGDGVRGRGLRRAPNDWESISQSDNLRRRKEPAYRERLRTNARASGLYARASKGREGRKKEKNRRPSFVCFTGEQELCEQLGMRSRVGRLHPDGHAAGVHQLLRPELLQHRVADERDERDILA